jgi:hypothetical protein
MKIIKPFAKNSPLFVVIISFLVFVIIGLVTNTSLRISAQYNQSIERLPSVRSLAPGFRPVSINGSRQEGYEIVFKNEYDKGIKAFDIGYLHNGVMSSMIRDLIYEDKIIAPGTNWTERRPYDPAWEKSSLTILSVVFNDGESKGRPESVKVIKGKRLGTKMQMANFSPMLERALQSLDNNLPAALDKLESEASSLPFDQEELLPPYVASSLYYEREYLLRRIREIRVKHSEGVSIREQLTGFKKDHDRKINALVKPLVQ